MATRHTVFDASSKDHLSPVEDSPTALTLEQEAIPPAQSTDPAAKVPPTHTPRNAPPPVFSDKQAEDQKESSARLEALSQKASRTLFRAKSVFPFDLFPDEVIIDDNKVDIIYGLFFFTKKVFTIPIHTLNGAVATADLFFGTLTIEISGYNENPQPVRFLLGADAMRARRLINGLIIAYKEGVDIELIETERLRNTIEEIGKAN